MHGFENDLLKADRDLRIEFPRQNRLIGHLHNSNGHRAVGDKRQTAGHHFVKHDAGGIDIGSGIDRRAAGLFGTDVIDRADGFISHGNGLGFGMLGDAEIGHLDGAVKELDADKCCRVKKVSEFIVTEPVGGVEQDDFLNGCLELETLYTPYELLDFLHKIEQEHNRERIVHWGPRTLDLDIILYDDVVMYEEDLIIPHIEMENRAFVLKPLCEIAPYIKNPVNGKSIKQLLSEIQK